ncbi:MAG TPA: DUF881 domain-containing protein [Acidimicrobiales bacterium]|nr:DUF881 domain-containing protein [Acidimicrobiales bacterium]
MRWRSSLLLAGVTGVLGFLLVTAAFTTRAAQRAAAPRKTELVHLIGQRRSQEADLEQAVRKLRGQIATVQAGQANTSRAQQDEAQREAELAVQAGTTALDGEGLTVSLSDSTREPQPSEDPTTYRIHDSDLQLVVNALFSAGAEAVAVNDNRIVATSPIRDAGDTLVVNFRPLSAPFRVVAVGADQAKFDRSDIVHRFHDWTTLYGLGFAESKGNVTVAAYAGRVAITDAQPVEPPAPPTTASRSQPGKTG